jgi:CMP-N-acetylneuraminic acid synthetase
MSEKIISLTLMRKGSKRFPNKCLELLNGDPLYLHTVYFARLLGYPYYLAHDYDSLYIPTDVNELKRKEEFAGDEHYTNLEIKDFEFDTENYIFLQVTNPIRNIEKIRKGIKEFLDNENYLCGIGVKEIKGKYAYNIKGEEYNFNQVFRKDNGCFDLESIFIETGTFYIFRKSQLNKKHFLDCAPEQRLLIRDDCDIDINYEEDLKKAEKEINSGN